MFLILFIMSYIPYDFQEEKPEVVSHDSMEAYAQNKDIPDEVREEILFALSHFPELKETPIEFKFKKKVSKSIMQAQPKVGSLLTRHRRNRAYVIKMTENFKVGDTTMSMVDEVPSSVLAGWIGHELGHIMDYRERNVFNMIFFGIAYSFSKSFLMGAERRADGYAVQKNMGNFIVATKNFILDNADLPEKYKKRIAKLYLSPEEILMMIEDFEAGEMELLP